MFRFKQFALQQDRCAMKVCTDACVLGAWANLSRARSILDIGTGTGLLALMAAQRTASTSEIEAIEIERLAFEQATENVGNSPFGAKIKIHNAAVQDFAPQHAGFDYVVCNPPFYENQLPTANAAANQAHHSASLKHHELAEAVARLLNPNGTLGVLLPPAQSEAFELKAARVGLHPKRALFLKHNASKPVFRVLSEYCFGKTLEKTAETLDIYNTEHPDYTPAFRLLLKDFYLIF